MRALPGLLWFMIFTTGNAMAQTVRLDGGWMATDIAIVFNALLPVAAGLAVLLVRMAWSRIQVKRNPSLARVYSTGWLPVMLGMAVLVAGLGATAFLVAAAREKLVIDAAGQFQQQVDRIQQDVESQFERSLNALRGIRGVFRASDEVTAQEYRDYVTTSDVSDELPGVYGFGLVVPDAKGHYSVKYMEPLERNPGELGLDMATEPLRKEVFERAMLSGNGALSGPLDIVRDGQHHRSFIYVLPMYAKGSDLSTEALRRQHFAGALYAPIVVSELLLHTKVGTQGLTEFQVFEGVEMNGAALLMDSEVPLGAVDSGDTIDRYQQRMFATTRGVLIGGHLLRLRFISTPAFERTVDIQAPPRLALTGAALAMFASLIVSLLVGGRRRAENLAAGMTVELDRLAMVARATLNSVVMTDASGRVTWVNEGFTRITGYTLAEALGQSPGALLQCPETDPAAVQRLRDAIRERRSIKDLILNRHKDGRLYWLQLEIQPLRNSRGMLTGFMAMEEDVTEQVAAREKLAREKERSQSLIEGANLGTWEINLRTGERHVSDRWITMLGYTREDCVPDIDTFWVKVVHPEDLVRQNNAFAAFIKGKTPRFSIETRVHRKDGSWMWILSRANIIGHTTDGRAEWMAGIHMDITESKRIENNLRDMESFLDRAGRVVGLGAWELNLRTQEIIWSDQTCAIHGVEPKHRPTMEEAQSFYPDDAREAVRTAIAAAVEQGIPCDLTTRFRKADGEELWVRSVGEVEYDESGAVRLVGAILDVTKEREAQLAIERNQAILRGAIDAINEAFVLYDPSDRLVFCNDKYRELYAASADLIVEGATFESIIRGGAERGQYAEALGRVDEWVAERMAIHRKGDITLEQRLNDGRWLRIVERRMPDGHIVGFRIDITSLKKAIEDAETTGLQLEQERERLVSILDGTNVGTWEWNVQTGEAVLSERWAGMFGYTLAELGHVDIDMMQRLAHPEDFAEASRRLMAHLAGTLDHYEVEVRMRHKDGHWVWVLGRGRVAKRSADGKPLWVSGTQMDISQRKAAQLELAETTATLQSVLDSAVDVAIIATDKDRLISVFNKGAENLFGYSARELVGRRADSILLERSQLAVVRESLALTLGREPTVEEVFADIVQNSDDSEWNMVRKDGTTFTASLRISPLRSLTGDIQGALGIISDISKQKDYEASLQRAMREAKESSVAKSQFLANMSHEIRTPMNAILGMLQLLGNTPLTSRQRDYTQKTQGAAKSLLGLLNDILDFSKVEAGKLQLDPEPFLLEDLLADLSVILSSNLGHKHVDLLFDVDPDIPQHLVGDVLRIKQVLINLGGNAVKFTEQGQVVIRWRLLGLQPDRVQLEVAVSDSGIGIAKEHQTKIFEAFTQAEASTTRRFGGTGLGLVISTRLVRLMGGELALHSELGKGTTFSFRLELPLAPTPARPGTDVQAEQGETVRALLVEDNAAAMESVTGMMNAMGWSVHGARSGQEAIAWIRAQQTARAPALSAVFVDWEMPDMDGWETVRAMLRLYGTAHTPAIVMMSGHGRDALSQRSSREQEMLDAFVVKPLTPGMLRKAWQQAHDHREHPRVNLTTTTASEKLLQGLRILLAEDNPINQQVAFELLTAQGAQVTMVDNGQMAVDALAQRANDFDVVLMDLQMPVMDGLTAARAIRKDLGLVLLPVIAMTANAMASDREACLAAGMNDHVGKPFDLDDLVATLYKHAVWPGKQKSLEMVVPLDAAANSAVDRQGTWPEGVDVENALKRMGGNRQLLGTTLHAFVLDATTLTAKLTAALSANNLSLVQRELHAFKGLCGTLGIGTLGALAARAVAMAKSVSGATDVGDLLQAITEVERELNARQADLNAVAQRLNPQPMDAADAKPVPPQAFTPALRESLLALLVMLKSSDMEAMELHAALRQRHSDYDGERVMALDNAMAELEFEAAAQACEKLLQDTNS